MDLPFVKHFFREAWKTWIDPSKWPVEP